MRQKLKLGKFIRFMWRFYVQQHSFGYLFTSFSHSLNILLISSFPSLRLKNVNTTVCKGQDASINFVRCMRLDIELQDRNNAKHSNTKQTYSQADQIMRWYLNSIKFQPKITMSLSPVPVHYSIYGNSCVAITFAVACYLHIDWSKNRFN